MLSTFNRTGLLWPTVAVLAGLFVLVGLGNWQMQRRVWKDGIIAQIKERSAQPPARIVRSLDELGCRTASMPEAGDPCEYQPLVVRGIFDHSRERHIFTAAPKAAGVPSTIPGGFWIFTPLVLESGSGGAARQDIFVNRGFVPETLKDASRRSEGQLSEAVEITGLYRSAQTRGTFDGANDPTANFWYVRNPTELWPGSTAGAYVDMGGPKPPGLWPLPLAAKVELSNRHLEYALTWYALAATLIGVYVAFAWGRVRSALR